ncbi:MAG: hypothetical protein HRT77_02010 [Halioglobus sp.]|nr:hypothetical protein [Halioglobus sp.]
MKPLLTLFLILLSINSFANCENYSAMTFGSSQLVIPESKVLESPDWIPQSKLPLNSEQAIESFYNWYQGDSENPVTLESVDLKLYGCNGHLHPNKWIYVIRYVEEGKGPFGSFIGVLLNGKVIPPSSP